MGKDIQERVHVMDLKDSDTRYWINLQPELNNTRVKQHQSYT